MELRNEILRFLKQLGRIPTSRFVGLTGQNYDRIKEELEAMNRIGLILKEEETKSTYWTITKKGESEIK